MNNLDNQIKEAFDRKNAQVTDGLKEEIWNGLEEELFHEIQYSKGEKKIMKTKKHVISLIIAVAAALLIAFSLQTSPGMAFIKSIQDMFVPEKEISQSIEGQEESTEVHLNEGKDAEYVIYIDETRYKMIRGENTDIITTVDPLPEKYPEVTIEIKQITNEKPEDLVQKIEAKLTKDFPELREIETVTEPVEGFLLHGAAGSESDSKIVHAYVISNGNGGSFVITENYFLEAAEGHGARFHHMLESFEIVEQ